MRSCRFTLWIVSGVLWGTAASLAWAADVAGGKDHPLVKRFEGSSILFSNQKSYDSLRLALEPVVFDYAEAKMKPFKQLNVEGRRTTIYYAIPVGIGPLEVIRNYENELKEKGFEILYSAAGEQIEKNKGDNLATEVFGLTPSNTNHDHPEMMSLTGLDLTKSQYLVAKLTRPTEGDVYVSVLAIEASWPAAAAFKILEKSTLVRFDVAEIKPMKQRMVTVTSTEMATQLDTSGKIALYGIYFDFNKADVKTESDPTLAEIAKLLHEQPKLRLLIVGHTDAVGTFESNRTLSQRRAEAVVAALSGRYGIDDKRLFPVGVSFAAPVVSNSTEEGRAKNRRVELVEILDRE